MKTLGYDTAVGFYPKAEPPRRRNIIVGYDFSRRPTASENETRRTKGLLC